MNEATKLADRLVKLEIVNVYLGDYFVGDEYISDSAERVINDGQIGRASCRERV